MFKGIFETHSLFWLPHQQFADEILNTLRQMLRKLQIHIQDFSIGLLSTLRGLKWGVACTELITENSYTPDIHHFIILGSHDDLWRHIIQSPTKCCPLISKFDQISYVFPVYMDQPKSANFTTLLTSTMFSGLRSRWMIPC